jgi:hypothetical protein
MTAYTYWKNYMMVCDRRKLWKKVYTVIWRSYDPIWQGVIYGVIWSLYQGIWRHMTVYVRLSGFQMVLLGFNDFLGLPAAGPARGISKVGSSYVCIFCKNMDMSLFCILQKVSHILLHILHFIAYFNNNNFIAYSAYQYRVCSYSAYLNLHILGHFAYYFAYSESAYV